MSDQHYNPILLTWQTNRKYLSHIINEELSDEEPIQKIYETNLVEKLVDVEIINKLKKKLDQLL